MMFSDIQLRAYLAGDLPHDQATALEKQIDGDHDLEARLLAFDLEQSAPIREAFLSACPPERIADLEAALPKAKPRKMVWKSATALAVAASTAVAVVLLSTLAMSRPDGAVTWREQVANYQALYVTDTLSHIEPKRSALSDELERSATALGRPLNFDGVRELDGLNLLRAQVLGFNGTPLVQMAYLSEVGVPIAFCVVQLNGDAEAGVTADVLAGLPSVSWSDGEFSYMIIGDIDASRLTRMAQDLQRTL